MEFKIQRSSGRCAATGREFREGEVLFSVLVNADDGLARVDFSEEGWSGPPDDAIAFWKGRVPVSDQPRQPLRDPDALLQLFERLGERTVPESDGLRYVLALLLARKRLFKLGNVEASPTGEILEVVCTRTNNTYRVTKPELTSEQMEAIESQLGQLMEADFGSVS